jgi:hypothetical protein
LTGVRARIVAAATHTVLEDILAILAVALIWRWW